MGQENDSNFFAFLLGGLIGGGLALLFAPRPGKETRDQLKEYMKGVEIRLKKQMDEVKDFTSQEVDKLKDKAKSAVEEGKKAFKEEIKKSESVDEA